MHRRKRFTWVLITLALLAAVFAIGFSTSSTWADTSTGARGSTPYTEGLGPGDTPTNTPIPVATCGPSSNYAITISTGSIDPGVTDIGNHCDDCSTNIALPFAYHLYGQPFDTVNVSSNGSLQFDSDIASYSNSCLPAEDFSSTIFGYWDDLRTDESGFGIFTSIIDNAPNRIFNIEWRALPNPGNSAVHFEIRLYEGQDRFDIIYGNDDNRNGYFATVGVQNSSGSAFTQYECNTGGIIPGRMLVFTQPVCGTPTFTVTGTQPTITRSPTTTSTPTITHTPTRTPTRTPIPLATCGPNSNYAVTTSTGSIEPGTTDVGNHCDHCTTNIALPFAYRLYGQSFNSANVGSNGTLQFASNYPSGYGPCVPSTFFDFSFAIFPFMTDLVTDHSVEQGIFTSVSGSAPNRLFNIEWRASLYSTNEPVNFEIRLYEGQDRFDIVYGQMVNIYPEYYFAVGAQRDTTAYTQYQCNGVAPNSGLILVFAQPSCGSPIPTFTGTPPTATSTVTPTDTRTPTFTRTATGTRTGTVTPTATPTPNTNTGFAHFAASGPITVTQGATFTLDLLIDTGTESAAAQQSYLTFTNSLLQVAAASTGACGVVSTTVSPDSSTFDANLQNEVCNSNLPCDFGRIVAPPASIAFASGALANPPASGDFRVAQIPFCATALGTARIHWEFSPPAPGIRHSEIVDANKGLISNPALYTDQVIHIVPNANNVLVGRVTWQGRPAQPSARQQLPITLTLKSSATEVNYPAQTTDANGSFTVTVGTLPNGTYNWRVKGPKYLANGGVVALTGNLTTNTEMGFMRTGDCNNDNFVNATDFIGMRITYGLGVGDPGYDDRADFTGDQVVNITDFNLLKINFGTSGSPPIGPWRIALLPDDGSVATTVQSR